MPREPRRIEPDVVYHIISRFIGREYFVSNQRERSRYLELQGRVLRKTDWRLMGYAIMSNHIHLVARAGRRPLDAWLRPVHSPFADMLNDTHQRIGPVFVRGPKAYPVAPQRVGHLLAYVHNNPVRANVVDTAVQSAWTSHRAYVGRADVPCWLDVELGLRCAGVSRAEFDAWVNDPARRDDRSFSEEAHELELEQQRQLDVLPKSAYGEVAIAIVDTTAAALDVPTSQIRGTSRKAAEVLARAVAVHCSAQFGLHEVDIARALNLSQQRVSVLRRQTPTDDVMTIASAVHSEVCALVGSRCATT